MARPKPPSEAPSDAPPRRRFGREARFLVVFLLILGGGFTLLAWNPVNDHFVEPFTAGVAKVSGVTLDLVGQDVTMRGTQIHGRRFAVDIRNGCNGLETVLIFLAAVLAFPAPWKARLLGLGLGVVAIQAVNLVRVVALYLTGAYFPGFFDTSHQVVWQTVVILCGVGLWILWADRLALPRTAAVAAAE